MKKAVFIPFVFLCGCHFVADSSCYVSLTESRESYINNHQISNLYDDIISLYNSGILNETPIIEDNVIFFYGNCEEIYARFSNLENFHIDEIEKNQYDLARRRSYADPPPLRLE
ncbi:hypothetical protein [Hyphobacterium marinum]|uniref:Lipoprotein n=1 Tax=Hyphobacterium marinum TaxID=3116574 RepID=A0ABU7LZT5_9PROT|nr:hypothetical protein [Hyphobacterium sp. Y6023]MEE2567074.1 hypothetical protein [Hyphobacterium sp. Y6023]